MIVWTALLPVIPSLIGKGMDGWRRKLENVTICSSGFNASGAQAFD